jgi:hypothetical protein
MNMIQILLPLTSLAIGAYFQWQAKRLRKNQWNVPNSYALGRSYIQIVRYENISKVVYLLSIIVICASFLF